MSGSGYRNIGPTAISRVEGRRSDICLEGRGRTGQYRATPCPAFLNEQSLPAAGSGSGLLTRPSSATKGLPVLDRRRVPCLPWNLSDEKKKELGKAGLPQGGDTS